MAEKSTKQRLMEAALDLFSQKGFEAASVDEIAESIGIKGPNIYKYFKGKQGMFDELLNYTDISYREKMGLSAERAAQINDAGDFRRFSLGQIEYTMHDETAKKMRKTYTIEQFRNKEIAKIASKYQFSNIMGMYEMIFARLIGNGIMKNGDPQLLSLEFFAPVTVLLQLCDREPEREDEAMELIRRHTDSFIERYFKDKA